MIYPYLLFSLVGFLLGGILFSYYLPLFLKGVDICALSRDHNPGAMNAFHYGGVPVGILCLACDLLKGFLPVFFAMRALNVRSSWFALVIAAPAAGHALAPFSRRGGSRHSGGKAIAVSFGALLGLLPASFLVFLLAAFYLFFSLVWIIRPHERRTVVTFSLFAACALGAAFYTGGWSFSLGALLLSFVVVCKNLRDAQLPGLWPRKEKEELQPEHR